MQHNILVFSILTALSQSCFADSDYPIDKLFDMPLQRLLSLQLESPATATPTLHHKKPASVTHISAEMIQQSGARSLFELLEIYVPNLYYIRHHWEAPHIGMRGIISDRDGKYLLLVNGRVMNEKTHYGAMSERDLPMLGDIQKIDIVRGSGSVVYGPGAISMVINITTENYGNSSGDAVIAKVGVREAFQSLELKKSITLGEQHGLYLYGGIANYEGADNDDAPMVYGLSDTTTFGEQMTAGEDSPLSHPNDHAAHRGLPKLKLLANYHNHQFDAWLRYTRGGEQMTWSHKILLDAPNGFRDEGTPLSASAIHSSGYQQLTLTSDYKKIFSDRLWLDLRLSYDVFDFERILFDSFDEGKSAENYREDEYFAKALLNWQISRQHALALGTEYTYVPAFHTATNQ